MTHSRKTRSRDYKEKKKLTFFGRLILPLSLILALALLYLSIKLFLAPEKAGLHTLPHIAAPVSSADAVLPSGDQTEEPEHDSSGMTKQPDGNEKSSGASETRRQTNDGSQKKSSVQTKQQTKPVSPAVKKDPVRIGSVPAGDINAKQRWDVQIGAFTAKSGAELTVKQARDAGCTAYITEAVADGKPQYKVRVVGSSDKAASSELAKRLEKAGFPVYLVSVNK